MKFNQSIGFTRDFDNPHQDDRDDPNKGVLPEFYERCFHKHNERGEHLYTSENGAEVVEDTGKPVMTRPILYIRFHTQGDPKFSLAARKAVEADKRTYAKAWDNFKRGKDFTSDMGTPLEQLEDMDIIQKATLNAFKIFSIEQLSDTPENLLIGNASLRNWVNKARDWRTRNKRNPNAELLEKFAALQAELDALKSNQATKTDRKAPKAEQGIAA